VKGLGFWVWGLGLGGSNLVSRGQGLVFEVSCFWFRIPSFGFRVSGFGLRAGHSDEAVAEVVVRVSEARRQRCRMHVPLRTHEP